MSLLIFSHANSYPASTYGQMFKSLRERGFTVKFVDKFGHNADYLVTNNWPNLVQELTDFAKFETDAAGEEAHFVGHSMGGFLSLMCAALSPEIAKSVLLIDAPILGGWRAQTLAAFKLTGLVGTFSPSAVSHKRTHRWPSREAALAHFQSKRLFAKWQPATLSGYVDAFVDAPEKGGVTLAFDRKVESAIYNTLPDNLDALLKKHPLQCPCAFIGGRASKEMAAVGLSMTEQVTKGRMHFLDGGHLFPMEQPVTTAATIEAALLNMARL